MVNVHLILCGRESSDGTGGNCGRLAVEDFDLRELVRGDAQRLISVMPALKHDFQQGISGAEFEFLDLRGSRQERCGNELARLQVHETKRLLYSRWGLVTMK
jgi:hypothetical protein